MAPAIAAWPRVSRGANTFPVRPQLSHQLRHQPIRLLDRVPRLVDEAGLEFVPPLPVAVTVVGRQ
jgi:hypothetical protein